MNINIQSFSFSVGKGGADFMDGFNEMLKFREGCCGVFWRILEFYFLGCWYLLTPLFCAVRIHDSEHSSILMTCHVVHYDAKVSALFVQSICGTEYLRYHFTLE